MNDAKTRLVDLCQLVSNDCQSFIPTLRQERKLLDSHLRFINLLTLSIEMFLNLFVPSLVRWWWLMSSTDGANSFEGLIRWSAVFPAGLFLFLLMMQYRGQEHEEVSSSSSVVGGELRDGARDVFLAFALMFAMKALVMMMGVLVEFGGWVSFVMTWVQVVWSVIMAFHNAHHAGFIKL